jgi:hypothetical protein
VSRHHQVLQPSQLTPQHVKLGAHTNLQANSKVEAAEPATDQQYVKHVHYSIMFM